MKPVPLATVLIPIIIVLAAAFYRFGSNEPVIDGPQAGEAMPMLTLQRESNTVELQAFRGQVVLLNIWAPWCAPCLAEMPSLQRLQDRMKEHGLVVIGLAPGEDRFMVEEFLHKQSIQFANFVDYSGSLIGETLRVTLFPQTFIIDRNGIIVERVVGERDWDSEQWQHRIEALLNGER